MRIVLDARTATDHFPGIGRYVANLARAMVPILDNGDEMTVLRDSTGTTTLDLTGLADPGVSVVDAPVSVFSLRQQWAVPPLLRGFQADVYHSSYYLMPYWSGVPGVVTIHDLIPLRYPEYYTAFQRLVYGVTIRLAARTCRLVLADSEATAADLQRLLGLDQDRIRVVPAAADPRFHVCTPAEVSDVRRKYGLPQKYLLHLSSGKPHKNLVRLVDAWALVTGERETAGNVLVLAGQVSPRYPEARDRIEALGVEEDVRVLGRIPEKDLPALYSGATWFVFPSLYEGFGLPVLEAMTCGTPVVCSNTSSLPEIAADAAITFDPVDTEAIAEALSMALGDATLREDVRQKAIVRAKDFGWEHTARLVYDCYGEVVAGAG